MLGSARKQTKKRGCAYLVGARRRGGRRRPDGGADEATPGHLTEGRGGGRPLAPLRARGERASERAHAGWTVEERQRWTGVPCCMVATWYQWKREGKAHVLASLPRACLVQKRTRMERGAVLFLFSGCLVSNGTEIKRLVKFIFIYIYISISFLFYRIDRVRGLFWTGGLSPSRFLHNHMYL